jgi:cell division protein FtsW
LPGLALFFFFAKYDYTRLRRIGVWLYGLSLLLLVSVFIPGIGANYGTHAHSWLSIFGYSFQPAEFAKLGLILFVANLIVARGHSLQDFKFGFFPTLIFGLIPVGLVVLQPDIGTVSILFAVLFGMLYIGKAKISHLLMLGVLGLVALGLLIWVAPYRAARLTIFMHPELDPQGIGYHINQAFLAVGSGGIFGRGLGNSLQKYQYLPEVSADSIYAIVAEEMGFVFAVGFIILLLMVARSGMKIAKQAPDEFGRLVVSGIIIWLITQSFLNIGAMVGIMPLTGVPLPFVSHGGTALMVAMGAVGIVVNISKYARK